MSDEMIVHPLRPIYDKNSKVLILGSFPSVVSRNIGFYYGNKTNRFWKILEILFDEEIIDKKEFCLNHHIALWDVIYSCKIHGSSDSSISDVQVNDINSLISKTNIEVIFTTGSKANSIYTKYINDVSIKQIALPSTSSANARMKLEDLVNSYSVIKGYL